MKRLNLNLLEASLLLKEKDMSRPKINLNPYQDINNSSWFKDITKDACQHSERQSNRIYVYFKTEEDFVIAVDKCKNRNIKCVGSIYNTLTGTWRLDILMNWKTRTPSKLNRKLNLVLN